MKNIISPNSGLSAIREKGSIGIHNTRRRQLLYGLGVESRSTLRAYRKLDKIKGVTTLHAPYRECLLSTPYAIKNS